MNLQYYIIPVTEAQATIDAQDAADAIYSPYIARLSYAGNYKLFKLDSDNLPASVSALSLTAYGISGDNSLLSQLDTLEWTPEPSQQGEGEL